MSGMIAGSLASITLTERDTMLMPITGGCTSTVTGGMFSAVVDPFMAARRPKPDLPPSFEEAKRLGLLRHGQHATTGGSGGFQYAAGIDAAAPDAAATDGGGPGGGNGCQTLTTYPDAGAIAATSQAAGYGDGTTMDYFINWIGILGDGDSATQDEILVSIELWPGYGMLADPAAPGTYTLSGEELDYQTCGVCVLTFGELTFDSMGRITDSNELYFATGGTVTLTTVE